MGESPEENSQTRGFSCAGNWDWPAAEAVAAADGAGGAPVPARLFSIIDSLCG